MAEPTTWTDAEMAHDCDMCPRRRQLEREIERLHAAQDDAERRADQAALSQEEPSTSPLPDVLRDEKATRIRRAYSALAEALRDPKARMMLEPKMPLEVAQEVFEDELGISRRDTFQSLLRSMERRGLLRWHPGREEGDGTGWVILARTPEERDAFLLLRRGVRPAPPEPGKKEG